MSVILNKCVGESSFEGGVWERHQAGGGDGEQGRERQDKSRSLQVLCLDRAWGEAWRRERDTIALDCLRKRGSAGGKKGHHENLSPKFPRHKVVVGAHGRKKKASLTGNGRVGVMRRGTRYIFQGSDIRGLHETSKGGRKGQQL